MECIGTEMTGKTATYGEIGDDYDSPRDFVVAQAWKMNDLKKYAERLGYYAGQPYRHRDFWDMIDDFAEIWTDSHNQEWYDLASEYFDGRELKDGEPYPDE